VKLIFFGTSEFALPALKKLYEEDFKIVGVVTQPDRPAGRDLRPQGSPVKEEAAKLKLPILQPSSLKIENLKLEIDSPDIAIVASYGLIIPKEVLDWPKYGCLNIHPSLLPKYRGPSPIQTAILDGQHETGVTIMKLDEKMDHGPIIAQETLPILRKGFTKLHDELARLGAKTLIDALPKYADGELKPVPQDDSKATTTKMINKDMGKVDWHKSADIIERQVRAYDGWPVAWTMLGQKLIKIYEAKAVASKWDMGKPGEILEVSKKITVKCGEGCLEIKSLQLAGGRRMTTEEYVHGARGLLGKQLN